MPALQAIPCHGLLIRELRNVVERLIILGGKSISKNDVEMYVMPKG